jgi:flagellar biosynthesis/type III secretory pathway chaperone
MNELIQLLIECLKEEAGHYRKLMQLAEQQKELLIDGKTDVLPENVRLEEKEVFALGPLIARRNELLTQMGKLHQLKTLSLTDALQRVPVEFIEEFKKAVIELVQTAKRLEEANQRNEKLLQNALSYVNFTLKIIANGGKKQAFSPSATLEEKKSSYINRIV